MVPVPSPLAAALAAAAVFACAAAASLFLGLGDGRFAAVWLPNALVVAMGLRWPRLDLRVTLPLGWAAQVALANAISGTGLREAAWLAAGNVLEIAVALWLVRRFIGIRPDLADPVAMARFVGLAAFAATIASSLLPAFASHDASSFLRIWIGLSVINGLSMMLIAPSAMITIDAWRNWRRHDRPPTGRDALDYLGWSALSIGVTIAVFAQSAYPFLFFCAPVILLHAYRFGMLATVIATLVTAIVAVFATAHDSGPISLMNAPMPEKMAVLQSFLAATFATGLPIAAALTRKRRLLAQLATSRRQVELLAHNVSDAILRFDLAGTCIDTSPSASLVMGIGREALIGRDLVAEIHPDSFPEVRDVALRLMSGESDAERVTYRRAEDTQGDAPVWIEADCKLVRDPATNTPETIVVSARNVSDRVLLERQLVRARYHAEQAALAKSQFLANMSHEIRTPMNGVLGFADLLRQADLPAEQARYVELIAESGQSMMRLLNDILDISKIEAGQIAVASEPVHLRSTLDGAIRLQAANAAQKRLALGYDIDPGLPETITGDALRLRQIVLNLLGNAIKFTPSGGVKLTARQVGNRLRIAVTDSGIGIPSDRMTAIFAPFEQADGKTAGRFGGTGLGLTISRQLAELMAGSLSVSSREGEGSTFTLDLPLVTVAQDPPAGRLVADRSAPDGFARGRSVLLAEDHDINRLLATAMLEQAGQQVTHAADGHDAVTKVVEAEIAGAPFDLVLMDIQMPGHDGYEAARQIRQAGIGTERLPIVALTANAFADDIEAARLAGMQGHLAKPLARTALHDALAQFLPVLGGGVRRDDAAPTQEVAKDDALATKWVKRRGEALAAVARMVREGRYEGEDALSVARTVHQLAGTAGLFGEPELGALAGRLEDALRGRADAADPAAVASELLAAA